jgi:hypothetical protein
MMMTRRRGLKNNLTITTQSTLTYYPFKNHVTLYPVTCNSIKQTTRLTLPVFVWYHRKIISNNLKLTTIGNVPVYLMVSL